MSSGSPSPLDAQAVKEWCEVARRHGVVFAQAIRVTDVLALLAHVDDLHQRNGELSQAVEIAERARHLNEHALRAAEARVDDLTASKAMADAAVEESAKLIAAMKSRVDDLERERDKLRAALHDIATWNEDEEGGDPDTYEQAVAALGDVPLPVSSYYRHKAEAAEAEVARLTAKYEPPGFISTAAKVIELRDEVARLTAERDEARAEATDGFKALSSADTEAYEWRQRHAEAEKQTTQVHRENDALRAEVARLRTALSGIKFAADSFHTGDGFQKALGVVASRARAALSGGAAE